MSRVQDEAAQAGPELLSFSRWFRHCWWASLPGAAGYMSKSSFTPCKIQPRGPMPSASRGAAEYDGRPSPVYRARLDLHLTCTTGHRPVDYHPGRSDCDQYTEGSLVADYLISKTVPERPSCRTESREHRRVGPPHRRHCARQRTAPAGNRQRRHAYVSHSCHLRCRRPGCAHLAPLPSAGPRQDAPDRADRPRNSQLHVLASASALKRSQDDEESAVLGHLPLGTHGT